MSILEITMKNMCAKFGGSCSSYTYLGTI